MARFSRRALFAASACVSLLAAAASAQNAAQLAIRRLAWAGVSFRVGGVEVFVDARAPSTEDGAPGPELTSDAPRRFALATHHHGDHLDLRALGPLLGDRGYLVVQEDVARLFDNRVVNVQPVKMYGPVFLSRTGGEFAAWPVPALDGLGSPQNAWVLDGGGKRVIHCGDTNWHGAWWDIARAYGPFDAAFLPINGARQVSGRYNDAGQNMIMNPEQAASAAVALRARLVVPIHYGAPPDSAYIEPPGAEAQFLAAARAREINVRVLRPGESMTL